MEGGGWMAIFVNCVHKRAHVTTASHVDPLLFPV